MARPKNSDTPANGIQDENTAATPPADETNQGAEKQGNGNHPNPPAPEQKLTKKRVKYEKLKGKKLIVGNKTIAFDADGIAELDAADAERLLTIPGYTEA